MNEALTNTVYSPNIYIKTKRAAILAVIKIVELLAALCGIFQLLSNDLSFARAFGNFTTSIGAATNQYNEAAGANAFLNANATILNVITWVAIIGLSILIVDCLCAVLLRLTGRMSGMIRFIHTLICIIMALGLILAIAGIAMMMTSIGGNSVSYQSLSMGYMLSYSALALAGIGITFGYHRGIASIMKTIGIERRTESKRIVKKSSLPRLCSYYAFWTAIPVVLAIVGLVLSRYGNIGDNPVLSNIISAARLIISENPSALVYEIGIGLFFVIKFILVGACAKAYNKEHQ